MKILALFLAAALLSGCASLQLQYCEGKQCLSVGITPR
jgi:uncharacterized protein YceK